MHVLGPCGDGSGGYTPGVTSAGEEGDLETVIAGDILPDESIRRISATEPELSSNIVGFEGVADKTAFREWVSKLRWQGFVAASAALIANTCRRCFV